MTKILVVEDDIAIQTGVVDLLEGEGYEVESADNGVIALETYHSFHPDLILLDVMLPEKSGYDVCREIRSTDPATPILMLTAKGQEIDKVVGLELGADDYIVKPFSINELLARVRAALRRSSITVKPVTNDEISFGNISINTKTMTGVRTDHKFSVTQREVELLQFFLSHENEVLSRNKILNKIWGYEYEGTTRTLDQHIARLRQKIEVEPSHPKYILTVHGVGYRFIS